MSGKSDELDENSDEIMNVEVSPNIALRAEKDHAYVQKYKDVCWKMDDETDCPNSPSSNSGEGTTVDANGKSVFIWTPPSVKLFLTLYEEHEGEFNSGSKRHNKIWDHMTVEMGKQGYMLNGTQLQSKLYGLKRTYRKIMENNETSGNEKISWPHFERMHQIFGSADFVQSKVPTTVDPLLVETPSAIKEAEENAEKKRKVQKFMEQYCASLKRERWSAKQERRKNRQERRAARAKQLDELMAQKDKHHQEKMEMLKLLLQSISK